jgi:CheY-specific phosphatase CheX
MFEIDMDIQKQIEIIQKMMGTSVEERDEMINSGMFNSIIAGYAILAMEHAGFTAKDIAKINFYHLFDTVSATEARQRASE